MAPAGFVTRYGPQLVLDGQPFRHIGVNVASLPYYGMPNAPGNTADIDTTLLAAACMGARVVRVFSGMSYATSNDSVEAMSRLADKAYSEYGLRLLVVLTNFYYGRHIMYGDDGYYTGTYQNLRLLNAEWFRSGYRVNYLPYVRAVVDRLQNHPGVFAWELGNELKVDNDPGAFMALKASVVGEIRAIDGNHLISPGIINTPSAWLWGDDVGRFYDGLDMVTLHVYNGDTTVTDIEVAQAVGLPHIVEEAGWEKWEMLPNTNRPASVRGDLGYWLERRGSQGYYPWAFMPTDYDNRDGDSLFGMDKVLPYHDDYEGLFTVLQDFTGGQCPSDTLPSESPPSHPPLSPVPGPVSGTLPLGTLAVGALAVGLFGYGVYRLASGDEED